MAEARIARLSVARMMRKAETVAEVAVSAEARPVAESDTPMADSCGLTRSL